MCYGGANRLPTVGTDCTPAPFTRQEPHTVSAPGLQGSQGFRQVQKRRVGSKANRSQLQETNAAPHQGLRAEWQNS